MKKSKNSFLILFIVVCAVFFISAGNKEEEKETSDKRMEEQFSIGVFIPGVVSGSPLYEMLVAGVEKAVNEHDSASMKIVEAGFNQSEWQEKLEALTATGKYDLVVTSNPSLPEMCKNIASSYPDQKFLIFDGYLKGHPQIYTFLYNQMEQSFLVGYLGGLITTSSMKGATKDLRVGLIAGQEYPIMNQVIRPGFEYGLATAASNGEVDFRVIGNWYDAAKATELASSMYDGGVDIILTIAGSANQGVVAAAKEHNRYVLWFDDNGYAIAPGVILGCAALRQEKAAYTTIKQAIEGTLPYGEAEIAGVKEGYVYFAEDDELYREYVPEEIRNKQHSVIKEIESGKLNLQMPVF